MSAGSKCKETTLKSRGQKTTKGGDEAGWHRNITHAVEAVEIINRTTSAYNMTGSVPPLDP